MNSLPSSVNYGEVLPSLPENATRYSVALPPTNGSEFLPSTQIQFQFPNRGYLIPDSLYLRYKQNITATATAITASIPGTPVFTPFQRLELQFGSVTVDSINNYHQVCNMLTNTTMDWSQKYGSAPMYGYSTSVPPTTEELDSRSLTIGAGLTEALSLACPLPCLLTNCDKLVPLWAMPSISLTLTLEALTNIISVVTNVSVYKLSNVELCFDFIELGSEVDAMVRGISDKIYLKSQSFSNSSVTIPANTNGSQSYIFNQRYASVKAAIVILSATTGSKLFEAIDTTSGTGQISINISGVQYPQKPHNTLNAKNAILMELKKVIGSIYDRTNNFSINNTEFNVIPASTFGFQSPGKFYVPFQLEKLHSGSLLTGISTNNSNISVNIDQTLAVDNANKQCNLILAYDALIEIDLVNKQSSVKV